VGNKILIVNQNSGYLTMDVANAFALEYEEVVVMYGLNKVTERNFHPRIKIQKTITYDRSSKFKRLWTWGVCTVHLFFLLLWKYRDYKILYYTNPPISYFNSLFFNNPFGIVVFDLYPDVLKLIGIKQSSLVYRIWIWVNKKVYSKSNQIITLSEGMKRQLINYALEQNIKVVPIWPAAEHFHPIQKCENPFIKKYNWLDKFIILYSGNMGIGHKLDVLIEVAERLIDNQEFLFLFIGEGAKKSKLIDLTHQKKLSNVSFLTWQDANFLPFSLAAADLAVVALEHEATYASVPSKTYNYMAVGLPILAIGSKDSELEKLIRQHDIGFYTNGNSINVILHFILDISKNKEKGKQLSLNSYNASKEYHYSQSKEYIF
jgi:hypothetical protein